MRGAMELCLVRRWLNEQAGVGVEEEVECQTDQTATRGLAGVHSRLGWQCCAGRPSIQTASGVVW